MQDEINSFITDFERAVQAKKQAGESSAIVKSAHRFARNLVRVLSEGESSEHLQDLARRARAIEDKLQELANTKTDLHPYLKKAHAMLALEDMFPGGAIQKIRELVNEGTAPVEGRRHKRLPFDLAVECVDCGEMIVGKRRGTPRWGHVRTFITRHDEGMHEGFSPQERLDLRAASTELEDGAQEVKVKRYRIFRVASPAGE